MFFNKSFKVIICGGDVVQHVRTCAFVYNSLIRSRARTHADMYDKKFMFQVQNDTSKEVGMTGKQVEICKGIINSKKHVFPGVSLKVQNKILFSNKILNVQSITDHIGNANE